MNTAATHQLQKVDADTTNVLVDGVVVGQVHRTIRVHSKGFGYVPMAAQADGTFKQIGLFYAFPSRKRAAICVAASAGH